MCVGDEVVKLLITLLPKPTAMCVPLCADDVVQPQSHCTVSSAQRVSWGSLSSHWCSSGRADGVQCCSITYWRKDK